MILWCSNIDGKSVAVPVDSILAFQEVKGFHTQTIIKLVGNINIEVQEKIVPLTDQYNKLKKEEK